MTLAWLLVMALLTAGSVVDLESVGRHGEVAAVPRIAIDLP